MTKIVDKTVILNLTGLDSNGVVLIGTFRRAARNQGWTSDEIQAVTNECMNGDYNHLLTTLLDHCEMPDDRDD
jgi:hypothetical protein